MVARGYPVTGWWAHLMQLRDGAHGKISSTNICGFQRKLSMEFLLWYEEHCQCSHRPRSLHIGKRILVIFSMISIGGCNKSWAPILAGGKADRHWISLPCLLYSWRENAVSMISGHCERESEIPDYISCLICSHMFHNWNLCFWASNVEQDFSQDFFQAWWSPVYSLVSWGLGGISSHDDAD